MVSICMHSGDRAREYIEYDDLVKAIKRIDPTTTKDKLISEAARLSEETCTGVVYWLGIFKARKMQGLCYPWEDKQ